MNRDAIAAITFPLAIVVILGSFIIVLYLNSTLKYETQIKAMELNYCKNVDNNSTIKNTWVKCNKIK